MIFQPDSSQAFIDSMTEDASVQSYSQIQISEVHTKQNVHLLDLVHTISTKSLSSPVRSSAVPVITHHKCLPDADIRTTISKILFLSPSPCHWPHAVQLEGGQTDSVHIWPPRLEQTSVVRSEHFSISFRKSARDGTFF